MENVEASEEELVSKGFVVVEPLNSVADVALLPTTSTKIEFSAIVPLPTTSNKKKSNRKPREKQHSEIMTSANYKTVLDEKRQRRDLKEQKKLLSQQTAGIAKKRGKPSKAVPNLSIVIDETAGIAKKRGRPPKAVPNLSIVIDEKGPKNKGRKRMNDGKTVPTHTAKKKVTNVRKSTSTAEKMAKSDSKIPSFEDFFY